MDRENPALRWIKEDVRYKKPDLDEFPLVGQRNAKHNIFKKMVDEPLVPIGLIATTACLTMGLFSMKRGDSRMQQLMMRGRVGFQFFTLSAMVFGILKFV